MSDEAQIRSCTLTFERNLGLMIRVRYLKLSRRIRSFLLRLMPCSVRQTDRCSSNNVNGWCLTVVIFCWILLATGENGGRPRLLWTGPRHHGVGAEAAVSGTATSRHLPGFGCEAVMSENGEQAPKALSIMAP